LVINVVSFEVCLKKKEYFTWPFWQCVHSLCIGHVLHKLISLKKNAIRNWNKIQNCNLRLSSYVTLL